MCPKLHMPTLCGKHRSPKRALVPKSPAFSRGRYVQFYTEKEEYGVIFYTDGRKVRGLSSQSEKSLKLYQLWR
jgi:hypothetical protein